MRFIIIHDEYKPEAGLLAREIEEWLKKGKAVFVELQPENIRRANDDDDREVVALVLGGDGFIMRQSKRLQNARIPLLGINFGRKGILAYAEQSNWEKVVEQILAGDYTVEKRMMLVAEHLDEKGSALHAFEVVNDVYIRHPKRMVVLQLTINGDVAHEEVHADGVVVCAPMGSTAYYRTSGGHPFPSGIGISFICPMDMNVAPLVQQDDDVVEVLLKDIGSYQKDPAFLIADGQDVEIKVNEKIVVRKSKKSAYFLRPNGLSWFHIAQRKLGLSK